MRCNFKYLFLLLSLCMWLNASVFTYEQALSKCYELNLEIQKPKEDGRIYTLNQMGSSPFVADYKNRLFLEIGGDVISKFLESGKGKRILEIGGCYGDLMLTALEQSENTIYTLNDLDERHLFIAAKCLSEKIQQNLLKKNSVDQVTFVKADIANANDIRNLGQFDIIYVGKVLHFLTPEQFELAVKHIYLLLKAGGKVYIVAFSPYLKYLEKFIPTYEKRVNSGEKYPGFILNPREFIEVTSSTPLAITSVLDRSLFALDPNTLQATFKKNGFQIIECKFTSPSNKSKVIITGKGVVVLIAQKETK